MLDFAAKQGVDWISQWLELWVVNSPCPHPCRVEWRFLSIHLFQSLKRCCWKRRLNSWSKDRNHVHVGMNQMNFNFPQTGQLIPACSMFRAPALERTSSRISIVPCWLGLIGTCARWLLNKSCLCDNHKLQTAKGVTLEHFVILWRDLLQ